MLTFKDMNESLRIADNNIVHVHLILHFCSLYTGYTAAFPSFVKCKRIFISLDRVFVGVIRVIKLDADQSPLSSAY